MPAPSASMRGADGPSLLSEARMALSMSSLVTAILSAYVVAALVALEIKREHGEKSAGEQRERDHSDQLSRRR